MYAKLPLGLCREISAGNVTPVQSLILPWSCLQEGRVGGADWSAEGSSPRGEPCAQPYMEVHHAEGGPWEEDLPHLGAV